MSCCPSASHGYLASDHKDEGKKITVNDIEVYEAGTQKENLVLVMPDVWGWNSGRLRAIVDTMAKEQDIFFAVPRVLSPPFEEGTDGDGLPPAFEIAARMTDLIGQIKTHWDNETVVARAHSVLAGYRDRGVKKVAVLGYCYGAWISFHLAGAADSPLPIVVGVGSHPSLAIEGAFGRDPSELGGASKCPWMLHPAGNPDEGGDGAIYDTEGDLFKKLEAAHPGKNETHRFASEAHGFVTRGAIKSGTSVGSGEVTEAAVSKALNLTAAFLKKHGF